MAERSRIGVVTGLAAEAATLPEDELRIALSAADPARAAQAVDAMIADGARLLLSYGFAAGLDPRLGPGTLLLPEAVVAHEGEVETPDRGGVRDRLPADRVLQAGRWARGAAATLARRSPAGG